MMGMEAGKLNCHGPILPFKTKNDDIIRHTIFIDARLGNFRRSAPHQAQAPDRTEL